MIKTIEAWATRILVTSIVILTLVGVLSIWDVFAEDVLWKSLSTIALVTFSSGLTLVVVKAIESHSDRNQPPAAPSP